MSEGVYHRAIRNEQKIMSKKFLICFIIQFDICRQVYSQTQTLGEVVRKSNLRFQTQGLRIYLKCGVGEIAQRFFMHIDLIEDQS